MLSGARLRAKRRGLPFNITLEDVPIPDKCPILGIPLIVGNSKPSGNSPSLDRFDPCLGYVKGNVWVISQRANMLKNNGTLEEFKLLVQALEEAASSRFKPSENISNSTQST